MNRLTTNYSDTMRTTDAPPQTIGRGSGCTIKEFNRRLTDLLRRKGMPTDRGWTTMPNFARHKPVPAPEPLPSRLRKDDPWAQL